MGSMIESTEMTYEFKNEAPSSEKFAEKVTSIIQGALPIAKVIPIGPMIIYWANLYEDGIISGTIAIDSSRKQIVSTRLIEMTGDSDSPRSAGSVSRELTGKVESKLKEIFPDLQMIT